MDEDLAIREAARRIHGLAGVVQDKYELHRSLLDVLRNVDRENYHKRYVPNLAYLVQGIEFNLNSISENQKEQERQRGRALERSWFSRLISLFGILLSIKKFNMPSTFTSHMYTIGSLLVYMLVFHFAKIVMTPVMMN